MAPNCGYVPNMTPTDAAWYEVATHTPIYCGECGNRPNDHDPQTGACPTPIKATMGTKPECRKHINRQ